MSRASVTDFVGYPPEAVMRTLAISLLMALSAASICQKKDDAAPPPATPPNGAPSASYSGQPQWGAPPGTPSGAPTAAPPGYGGQPPPPGMATAAPPAGGGQMSVPGPAAFPCANDTACGLAHCNTQYGKCVFPCVNAEVDCIQGAACLAGFCIPKPPGQ
jgi:hypothetical protein